MSCCTTPALAGTDSFFSQSARSYIRRFRKNGLAKEQRLLVDAIASISILDRTVLEIGCGIGGLHLTLLAKGARCAVGVDVSKGMLEGATSLAKELGWQTRTSYLHGDAVVLADRIESADITVLDKVVCCYEDIDSLLATSLAKTRIIYALSFPQPNHLAKLSISIHTLLDKLFQRSFHPYWHDWHQMIKRIETAGFRQEYSKSTMFWNVRVFRRFVF